MCVTTPRLCSVEHSLVIWRSWNEVNTSFVLSTYREVSCMWRGISSWRSDNPWCYGEDMACWMFQVLLNPYMYILHNTSCVLVQINDPCASMCKYVSIWVHENCIWHRKAIAPAIKVEGNSPLSNHFYLWVICGLWWFPNRWIKSFLEKPHLCVYSHSTHQHTLHLIFLWWNCCSVVRVGSICTIFPFSHRYNMPIPCLLSRAIHVHMSVWMDGAKRLFVSVFLLCIWRLLNVHSVCERGESACIWITSKTYHFQYDIVVNDNRTGTYSGWIDRVRVICIQIPYIKEK